MQINNVEQTNFGNEWGLFIDIETANAELNYNKNKTKTTLYTITNLEVIYETFEDEYKDELFCNKVIISNNVNVNDNNIKKIIQKYYKISLCLITICIIIIIIII